MVRRFDQGRYTAPGALPSGAAPPGMVHSGTVPFGAVPFGVVPSGAGSSVVAVVAARAVNHPTVSPAATGTAPAAQCRGVPGPGSGTAASSGNGGSSGAGAEENGSTTWPVPRTKPGPREYAAAHTAAFGTRARHSSSTANCPTSPP